MIFLMKTVAVLLLRRFSRHNLLTAWHKNFQYLFQVLELSVFLISQQMTNSEHAEGRTE